MLAMRDTICALQAAGLRESVKVIVGGAPLTQRFAQEIGVDGYAPDAASAVDLARELVIHEMPESFPNPWKAGAFSGGAFIIGAIVPLVGYFFLEGVPAVLLSAGLSVAALFVIGALKTLFTGLPWLKSGLEMVGIGILATAITYLIGRIFGVQLS